MVQAGIGEHAADGVEVTDILVGIRVTLPEDDDGPLAAFEKHLVFGREDCDPVDDVRPDHHRYIGARDG